MKAGKPGHHYDEDSHQWVPDAPADASPAKTTPAPAPAPESAPKE